MDVPCGVPAPSCAQSTRAGPFPPKEHLLLPSHWTCSCLTPHMPGPSGMMLQRPLENSPSSTSIKTYIQRFPQTSSYLKTAPLEEHENCQVFTVPCPTALLPSLSYSWVMTHFNNKRNLFATSQHWHLSSLSPVTYLPSCTLIPSFAFCFF